MRDEEGELQVPRFQSEIPEHLIASLSLKEKWQYEQISIQGKQNQWLIQRSVKADKRQNETDEKITTLDTRVKVFEELKTIMTAKWSLVGGLFIIILIPAALAVFGAWIIHWFEKH